MPSKSFSRYRFAVIPILVFLSASSLCNAADHWVGTWSTAPQLVEPRNMPPEPGLSNCTLRQVVHVSIGGETLRMRFSNEFSEHPVTMKSVHIAVSSGMDTIDTSTDMALSFDGKPDVTMKPGGAAMSDRFYFQLRPLSNVAITIFFGDTSPDVTGHPGSRTTSFLISGNKVSDPNLPDAAHTDHWYVINTIDVISTDSAAALAVLGNSITDGRGSGTNKQNRWPDELARRLQDNNATRNVAVLNEGIGGNCVLRNCLGPSALDRFKRDVLDQSNVRWLIILEGINDIGRQRSAESAQTVANGLIAAYQQMIGQAHAQGISVYGATMTPFAGSFYDSEFSQTAWKKVNDWIRNGGKFDAVIDLDKALEDPDNPGHMLPAADAGDHLHPSEAGHRMMGEAVDLMLLQYK